MGSLTSVNAAEYMAKVPRDEQEKRGKIRTFTGKLVDPLFLQYPDIDIRDIAHHTANICRYTGAVPKFYSVAQHSVLVARYFLLPMERAAGLLHDGAEAYLNDIASPLKRADGMEEYVKADERATGAIFEAFGIPRDLLPKTKQFDDLLFQREVASFWPGEYVAAPDQRIVPWSPARAEKEFLAEFERVRSVLSGRALA